MYSSQASTNSRSGRPFSAGASLSEVVGTRLEESYNNEITPSSALFNLIPKGRSFLGSTEGTYNVGDNGWEKNGADRFCCMDRVYGVETL